MKKILYSILTLVLGLVLSGSGCGRDPIVDPSTTDAGIKIGSVTWATRNVGEFRKFAANPEDAGMFYQWNRKTAWPATGATVTGWDSSTPSGSEWAPANDPCPAGWRVPTKAQMDALVAAGSVWGASNDVDGRYFGSGANTIFLPAVGWRKTDGSLNHVGDHGYYLTSDQSTDVSASILYFTNLSNVVVTDSKAIGYSVRCVKI